ncbi:MAG: helix-turn-helix domain-containing protein [Nitriliruptorales bacterium]|nr:helix-turn-helix domain-containing protein [Nitriliruptorales bacterium]
MSDLTPITDLDAELGTDSPEYRDEYDRAGQDFAIAEFAYRLRVDAGLTQQELADRMGTSRPAVARLEGGAGNPTLRTLQRLAAAVGRRIRLVVENDAPSPDAAVVTYDRESA